MITLAATLAASLILTQDEPKRDTSGEKDLQALFATYGKIKSVHFGLVRYQSEDAPNWEKEGNLDFWYQSPKTYRSDYNSVWNDSTRQISDGKTLSIDSGDTITLRNLPDSIFSRNFGANPEDNGGIILQLLAGPSNYTNIVSDTGDITSKPKGNAQAISFKHKWGVDVTLLTKDNQVTEIWYTATRPTFNGIQNLTIREVVAEFNPNPKFPAWLFNTTPAPNRAVEDTRG